MQDVGFDGLVLVAPGKEKALGPRQTPVAARNCKQLLREHDVAVLAALAAFDPDDHAGAVDVGDLQARHLGDAPSRGVGRRQRHARLKARNGFEKANDLIAAQHSRQLARRAGVGDPFRDRVLAERDAVKEAQRADDLIERSPGNARGRQMHLKGADILQSQLIWGTSKISAELRDAMDVGSLGRRREIADRHVLDHATAQRADLGHLEPPV